MAQSKKERATTKPRASLDKFAAASGFADIGETPAEPPKAARREYIIGQLGENAAPPKRIFLAPAGDRRLTVNLREGLHKQLKQLALEHDTTAGLIIEQLLEEHLDSFTPRPKDTKRGENKRG